MPLSNSTIKEANCFRFKNSELLTLRKTDLDILKKTVDDSELKRFRYCLHASDDDLVQEMLIGFRKGSVIPVHRHKGKSESFHVVQGILDVVFFNNQGKEIERIRLGDINSSFPFMYRLATDRWHTVDIVSDYVVIHETTTGPFRKNDMELLENEI